MTIKQLQYIIAVADNQFNISLTAEKLFTSQPGISKQIKLLEESLGCSIFSRNGKALTGLTDAGEQIIKQARIIITEYQNLLRITEHPNSANESLKIATTSTQSNYVLPEVLSQFHKHYPELKIHIQDGNMDQLIDAAKQNEVDCIILSGVNARLQRDFFSDMLMIPCYEWYQALVCHNDHPLAQKVDITIEDLVSYPIITYPTSKHCGSAVEMILSANNLCPNILATSNDPNTIKRYASMDMGIGLIAPMAYDRDCDSNLTAISLEKLLPKCTTIIAVERHNILKPHVYRFIKLFAPHLTNEDIDQSINNTADIVPEKVDLPEHIETWVI
ncbi:MAG: LysR family transcriptional regulator [Gammaproteobacteria bacterium]|nr:LysR family transcriptional regulator [Gammaproteobacteria bacterium]